MTLKPCPFCPGRPTVTRFSCGDDWNYQPSCPSCGAYIDKEFATYEEAEAAWNHRPGEEAAVEVVARYVEDDRGLKELARTIRERFGGDA